MPPTPADLGMASPPTLALVERGMLVAPLSRRSLWQNDGEDEGPVRGRGEVGAPREGRRVAAPGRARTTRFAIGARGTRTT